MRYLVRTALVACALLVWCVLGGRVVTLAQQRTPIKISRFFTGPDKLTHYQNTEVKWTGEGTGAAVREVSEKIAVTDFSFHRTPPTFFSDWHPAPKHYYVINLNGREDFETADGAVPHYPGHILEAGDFTGKGHISRGLGNEDRIALFVSLAQ